MRRVSMNRPRQRPSTPDGTVISILHRRYGASEFKKFLAKIGIQVPVEPSRFT